jgi:hypothetical protein
MPFLSESLRRVGVYDYGLYGYAGGFTCNYLPDNPNEFLLGNWDETFGNPLEYGATCWRKFQPLAPKAGLAQFLGELKDLPHQLRDTAKFFRNHWRMMSGRSRRSFVQDQAGHYLNLQFGWIPFVRDLVEFFAAQRTVEERLAQIKRDNGNWIRRSGTLFRTHEEEVIGDYGNFLHPIHQFMLASTADPGSSQLVRVIEQEVWFAGSFRYWIPDIDTSGTKSRLARRHLGLELNPALVWELMPWSWLIDWWSNYGTVVHNLSYLFQDNLAAKFAYCMCHRKEVTEVRTTTVMKPQFGGTWRETFKTSFERKARAEATPFGFALKSSEFTGRQWSIIAALGLSRLRSAVRY